MGLLTRERPDGADSRSLCVRWINVVRLHEDQSAFQQIAHLLREFVTVNELDTVGSAISVNLDLAQQRHDQADHALLAGEEPKPVGPFVGQRGKEFADFGDFGQLARVGVVPGDLQD